jgi:hypothetical protein
VTSHERAQRNVRIIEARARGLSWPRIAHMHGISDRQARRIVADYRASGPALHDRDPVEIVEETLEAYETAIADLVVLAEETNHDSTRLGAIKARLDVYQARNELLRTIGVLPSDLGSLHVAIDLSQIAGRLVALFEHAQVPERVKAEILDAIDPRADPPFESPQAGVGHHGNGHPR